MKLVVDAIGIRAGSAATVIGNLLLGWAEAMPDDELYVLTDQPPDFVLPPEAHVVQVAGGRSRSVAARFWAQSWGVRRACARLRADALLSALNASSFAGAPCRSATIVYDLRHELRRDQFALRRRLIRRLTYGWSFLRSDHLFCISERTRSDLSRLHPRVAHKAVATVLGADHASKWSPADGFMEPYVLAFGHFSNKNVEPVIRSWAITAPRHPEMQLRISGIAAANRPGITALLSDLRISDRVELLPWLSDQEFERTFAAASAVMYPSDFEGFGLPAVEAMLLGIPLVISSDPALAESTAGHAATALDTEPASLAAALEDALARSAEELARASQHARGFSWARTARQMRDCLTQPRTSVGLRRYPAPFARLAR